MNISPQHLLSEDRVEFERLLDETLASAPTHPELAALGERLNGEQLRTMALNATGLITAAAADEYQHYVRTREELRVRPSEQTGDSGVFPDPSPPVMPSPLEHSDGREAGGRARSPQTLVRRIGAAVLGVRQPGGQKVSVGVPQQR
ncbi:hypothetical protein ACFVJ9_51480, partial [Streptomyces sp. NPDC127574]